MCYCKPIYKKRKSSNATLPLTELVLRQSGYLFGRQIQLNRIILLRGASFQSLARTRSGLRLGLRFSFLLFGESRHFLVRKNYSVVPFIPFIVLYSSITLFRGFRSRGRLGSRGRRRSRRRSGSRCGRRSRFRILARIGSRRRSLRRFRIPARVGSRCRNRHRCITRSRCRSLARIHIYLGIFARLGLRLGCCSRFRILARVSSRRRSRRRYITRSRCRSRRVHYRTRTRAWGRAGCGIVTLGNARARRPLNSVRVILVATKAAPQNERQSKGQYSYDRNSCYPFQHFAIFPFHLAYLQKNLVVF